MQIAGHRPAFREYPLEWITRHLEAYGFTVEATASFPCVVGVEELKRQLQLCQRQLDVQEEMHQYAFNADDTGEQDQQAPPARSTVIENLQAVASGFRTQARVLWDRVVSNSELVHEGVCFGMDYAVAARKRARTTST